jgi:hypothetical protein
VDKLWAVGDFIGLLDLPRAAGIVVVDGITGGHRLQGSDPITFPSVTGLCW